MRRLRFASLLSSRFGSSVRFMQFVLVRECLIPVKYSHQIAADECRISLKLELIVAFTIHLMSAKNFFNHFYWFGCIFCGDSDSFAAFDSLRVNWKNHQTPWTLYHIKIHFHPKSLQFIRANLDKLICRKTLIKWKCKYFLRRNISFYIHNRNHIDSNWRAEYKFNAYVKYLYLKGIYADSVKKNLYISHIDTFFVRRNGAFFFLISTVLCFIPFRLVMLILYTMQITIQIRDIFFHSMQWK